jgi:diaminopimelate epimerase
MFNPVGGEFERSGNGLRVLGAYLFSRGWVEAGSSFPIRVGGDEVAMEILGSGEGGTVEVAVEMGQARFGMEAVGGEEAAPEEGGGLAGPDGALLDVQPVSVGNPHCVTLAARWTEGDLLSLGPHLTVHPAFPRGTNVQLASVPGPGRVEILIWERGVGRTTSSGTSACAAAAACVRRGLLEPGPIQVGMEGGSFVVAVSPQFSVRLEGPVQPVLEGELRDELLDTLE